MNRLNRLTRLLLVVNGDLMPTKTWLHMSPSLHLKKINIKQDERQKTITIEGESLDAEASFGNRVLKLDKLVNDSISRSNDDEKQQHQQQQQKRDHDHDHTRPCALCVLEKQNIFVQYTDVLVLRQFLTQDGALLSRSVTGLCWRQQKKLIAMTKLAKHAGLIMNLQPLLIDGSMPNTDVRKRQQHLKWNSYFDDYETMRRNNKFI